MVPYLEWAITSAAIEHLRKYYLLHAGAVAFEGRGVILPGAPESGKTTLVAGLVLAAGFRFLSDEVATLDPTTGCLLPFARSLFIREGSREVLTSIYPMIGTAPHYRQADGETSWYVSPRTEWLPEVPAVVRAVILPRYVPGAPAQLSPAPRSLALQHLLEQSFNLRDHQASGIGNLVKILQTAECYELTFGDVREAAAVVRRVVAREPARELMPI